MLYFRGAITSEQQPLSKEMIYKILDLLKKNNLQIQQFFIGLLADGLWWIAQRDFLMIGRNP